MGEVTLDEINYVEGEEHSLLLDEQKRNKTTVCGYQFPQPKMKWSNNSMGLDPGFSGCERVGSPGMIFLPPATVYPSIKLSKKYEATLPNEKIHSLTSIEYRHTGQLDTFSRNFYNYKNYQEMRGKGRMSRQRTQRSKEVKKK